MVIYKPRLKTHPSALAFAKADTRPPSPVRPLAVPTVWNPTPITSTGQLASAHGCPVAWASLPVSADGPLAAPPAAGVVAGSSATDTYSQGIPDLPVVSAGRDPKRGKTRRKGVPDLPPSPYVLGAGSSVPPSLRTRFAGAKHARVCGGPFVACLALSPDLPPSSGARRAKMGMGGVTLTKRELTLIKRQRSARALVSLLPRASALYVLHPDTAEHLASLPDGEIAERLVRVFSRRGQGSTQAAYSALGRLITWVRSNRASEPTLTGSVVDDWYRAEPPSKSTLFAMVWLKDWCGIDLPARSPVAFSYRGDRSTRSNSTESFTPLIFFGLEIIAGSHPNPRVRAHAAGWNLLARAAFRFEQSSDCCINALVEHVYQGRPYRLLVGSVALDKNPDPENQKPRPFWAPIDGVYDRDAIVNALFSMIDGFEDVRCILLDTDSPDGDPSKSTAWERVPLISDSRRDASLHALLQMQPICMSPQEAATFHGHGGKRFPLTFAEASPHFTTTDGHVLGRFSESPAQDDSLEPSGAMLARHTARMAVLPAIYSRSRKVAQNFDLLARLQRELVAAGERASEDPSRLSLAWGEGGVCDPISLASHSA